MDSTRDPGLVYVIDDDANARRTLAALLAVSGLDHQSYESADLFLRQYTDRGPACIVSDICMPGLTGLQMLDRLHELDIHYPVIFMTGYSDVDTAVQCFRHGAADFFEKPVNGASLLARVRKAIDSDRVARHRHELRRDTLTAMQTLSPRERQVMDMLFAGQCNKAIAHALHLSEKTIAAHRAHILEKMHTTSLPVLVRTLVSAEVEAAPAHAA